MILFFLVLVYCPKGYEILAAENETCRECPRGFYKDNSNVFSSCTACPSGNTTEGSKSTSIESCSISKLGFKCFSACRNSNQRNIAFVMLFWLRIVVVLSDKNFYFKWLLAGQSSRFEQKFHHICFERKKNNTARETNTEISKNTYTIDNILFLYVLI